jgi:hypothetical protein
LKPGEEDSELSLDWTSSGVSGRMIYVRYHRSQGPQDIVQNNPVYETKTYETQNPVYKTEMPKT